jgi:septum formation protein
MPDPTATEKKASPAREGTPRLVLASRSPRRREMLSAAGVRHEAAHPGVEDGGLAPGAVSPSQWVAALAYLKADAGLRNLIGAGTATGRVVLGADTTCVVDGHMLGTPVDAADALRMLRLLENREHEVLTGVALIDSDTRGRVLFTDRAVVRIGSLGALVAEYVAMGGWRGKAGAYNLADRTEAGWPIECTGDPTTVMGLPMRALLPRLTALGLMPAEEAA